MEEIVKIQTNFDFSVKTLHEVYIPALEEISKEKKSEAIEALKFFLIAASEMNNKHANILKQKSSAFISTHPLQNKKILFSEVLENFVQPLTKLKGFFRQYIVHVKTIRSLITKLQQNKAIYEKALVSFFLSRPRNFFFRAPF